LARFSHLEEFYSDASNEGHEEVDQVPDIDSGLLKPYGGDVEVGQVS
jgi:hypothetical protein